MKRLLLGLGATCLLVSCGREIDVQGKGTGQGGSGSATVGTSGSGAPGSSTSSGTTGAAGGMGGSIATTSSVGSTSSTTATTSSGPTLSAACVDYCDAAKACEVNCIGSCDGFTSAGCTDEGNALVACMAANFNPSECAADGCDTQAAALGACLSAHPPSDCVSQGSLSGSGNCSGRETCGAGQHQALCDIEDNVATCNCTLNDVLLGQCTQSVDVDDDPPASCDFAQSCCNAFLGG